MVRYRSLAAAAAALLLLAPVVVGIAALLQMVLGGVEYSSVWIGVAACVALVLFSLVVRRDAGRGEDESTDVWEFIPSWQYTGRHAESGGLSRDEQEAALSDVEEHTAERERGLQ